MSLFQMIQASPPLFAAQPIPAKDDPDRYSDCVNEPLPYYSQALMAGRYGPPSSGQAQQFYKEIVHVDNLLCAEKYLLSSIEIAKKNILPKTNFMERYSHGVTYVCDVPSNHIVVLSLAILIANVPNTPQDIQQLAETWITHSTPEHIIWFIRDYCKPNKP